jgi:hypothetical protein
MGCDSISEGKADGKPTEHAEYWYLDILQKAYLQQHFLLSALQGT